jgi:ribonuclease-3
MSTNPLTDFEEKIGYRFRDIRLLTEAITHSTYAYEHADKGVRNNERLEFLGDSVLGLTVSYLLMQEGEDLPEGSMSQIRARIVREETLHKAATDLELHRYLRLGKGEELTGGRQKASNLADALEAVFGAICLDSDFETAFQVVRRVMQPYFDLAIKGRLIYDYKTTLIERVQAMGTDHHIEFILLSEEGPVHNRRFTVQVCIDDAQYGIGSGPSKKAAEQQAACLTLNML